MTLIPLIENQNKKKRGNKLPNTCGRIKITQHNNFIKKI